MEGLLYKRGGGTTTFGRRTWKERWFVLADGELRYYASQRACQEHPDEPLKGRVIDIRGASARPATEEDLGSLPPECDSSQGFVIEPAAAKPLIVCADRDEPKLVEKWMRVARSFGCDIPTVAPPPPTRPVRPPGEPTTPRSTATFDGFGDSDDDTAGPEDGTAPGATTDGDAGAPAPQIEVPVASEAEQAAEPELEVDVVEESAHMSAGVDAQPELAVAAEAAADAAERDALEKTSSPTPPPPAPPSPPAPPAAEAEAEAEAEGACEELTRSAEADEARLEQELLAMAPPPEDRDDADLADATRDNLETVFSWMDVNGDGAIQVVEFTNATSGRHRDTIRQAGISIEANQMYKIPGCVMDHTDFQKLSLFQRIDVDGDATISSEEWIGAFEGSTDRMFLQWMSGILRQLRDIQGGFRPVRRSD